MEFYAIGDVHGNITQLIETLNGLENSAIICLGDFGANYYLNKTDHKFKEKVQATKNIYYLVEGNHEEAPTRLGFTLKYDELVDGEVYVEDNFPNIRYFKRYGIYTINGWKCLVIGGAYSVDKNYRLMRGLQWFEDEQLSGKERAACIEMAAGQHFDFVFSHTCPYKYIPSDLFLPQIDQSTVDNTMEWFLNGIEENITYGVHIWGHYHADRLEAPHCEMMYKSIQKLEDIKNRWDNYDKTGILDEWYLRKSPKFYMH